MPLTKLQFKPGINREVTTLSNEGGWYDSDKVRFRYGYPQKIGGWEKDSGTTFSALKPPSGAYWGVARSLISWQTLSQYNLLGIGTNLKYYIQNTGGGDIYDVTPIRETTAAGGVTFAATAGSSIITVTDTGHNSIKGDFVTFSGAVSLGGAITAAVLNAEHQVLTYVSSSQYTIDVGVEATAGDTGNGGASVVGVYQLNTGSEAYSIGVGWGAGGWSGSFSGTPPVGWGQAASVSTGIGIQMRLWSRAVYGQDLIICPRGGQMSYWAVNTNPNTFDRAQPMVAGGTVSVRGSTVNIDSTCPSVVNQVLVSDSSRFAIAFGTNDPSGTLFSTALDPLLIRWSDQEQFGKWTPSITNQAGDYRLSIGSEIVCAQQTRQEILIWTDTALYSMQYQGPPYVWGVQPMGSNLTIAGPNTVITTQDTTYWMGVDKFYMYNGRVATLPSDVRKYVFDDINIPQRFQFFAGGNSSFGEVWWFYCSAHSNLIDRYVVFNYQENLWYYGTLARTAWIDSSYKEKPVAAGYNGNLFYHEVGNDDGSTNPPSPIEAYIQSADFDIGDGHNFGFVHRLIPDLNFDGSEQGAPSVTLTLQPRQFPGTNYGAESAPGVFSANNYGAARAYTVQQFTPQVFVRVRGRQMALRVSSNALGVAWKLGSPRMDVRPDGRR